MAATGTRFESHLPACLLTFILRTPLPSTCGSGQRCEGSSSLSRYDCHLSCWLLIVERFYTHIAKGNPNYKLTSKVPPHAFSTTGSPWPFGVEEHSLHQVRRRNSGPKEGLARVYAIQATLRFRCFTKAQLRRYDVSNKDSHCRKTFFTQGYYIQI